MKKIDIINLKGEKTKDIKLNEDVFNTCNDIVLKKAIRNAQNSLRQGTSKVKTRSEVSGGGRKPYRQKGTGNARQGSIRAPHYKGGGIVFGPTRRSYAFKTNRKERVLALKSALTHKVNDKELVIVESLELKDLKTKSVKDLIKTLKLEGKVLFVTKEDAENLYMATRNLGYADTILVSDINVLDIVNSDTLVIEEEAFKTLEEVLS